MDASHSRPGPANIPVGVGIIEAVQKDPPMATSGVCELGARYGAGNHDQCSFSPMERDGLFATHQQPATGEGRSGERLQYVRQMAEFGTNADRHREFGVLWPDLPGNTHILDQTCPRHDPGTQLPVKVHRLKLVFGEPFGARQVNQIPIA